MPKYIDADALRKRMEQIAEESKPAATARPMREDTPSELLRYGTARAMIEWLDEIPAADVEPKRKTGRWIIAGAFDDFYQCSECGKMWPIFSTIEWKCCPICECKIITNRPKGEGECLLE